MVNDRPALIYLPVKNGGKVDAYQIWLVTQLRHASGYYPAQVLQHRDADIARAPVVDSAGRPADAKRRRGPNSKKRLPAGQHELKRPRKAWMRATYDVNKELTDHLSRDLTIVIGRTSMWEPGSHVIFENKKSRS